MKLTIKLNLDNFENQEFVSNEYDTLEPCYREQIIFLKGWVDYTPYAQPLIDNIFKILSKGGDNAVGEGEKSVKEEKSLPSGDVSVPSDSSPLPKVVQTQNFVDVRECKDYSEKSYKLIGYDEKYVFLAKSLVIRTESLKEGGTRVIVPSDKAWIITKMEWKT